MAGRIVGAAVTAIMWTVVGVWFLLAGGALPLAVLAVCSLCLPVLWLADRFYYDPPTEVCEACGHSDVLHWTGDARPWCQGEVFRGGRPCACTGFRPSGDGADC